MTKEEIYAECDGYMTISDDGYKARFVYKVKDDQILFPFKKIRNNIDDEWPTYVNLMYLWSDWENDTDYMI